MKGRSVESKLDKALSAAKTQGCNTPAFKEYEKKAAFLDENFTPVKAEPQTVSSPTLTIQGLWATRNLTAVS